MKSFAVWLMKGRMQAVTAATVLAVLALLVTPLALLSAAVITLTVLRQGWQEGAIVVGASMAAMAGLGFLLLQMPLAAALVGAMIWLPAAVLGGVLGLTRSLRSAIEAAALGAVAIVALQHLMMANPTAFWTDVLNEFLVHRIDAETLSTADLGTLVSAMASWMTGGVAVAWLIGSVISLLLAQRWSDMIDGVEGAGTAFQQLRFSRWLLFAVPAALLYVIAVDGGDASLVGHLYLIGMMLYLFQGLAVAHALVAMYSASVAWLVGLYLLVILVAPQGATMVAAAGYADGWLDLRARARTRRPPGDGQ
jgi:hypothetical protein